MLIETHAKIFSNLLLSAPGIQRGRCSGYSLIDDRVRGDRRRGVIGARVRVLGPVIVGALIDARVRVLGLIVGAAARAGIDGRAGRQEGGPRGPRGPRFSY